MIPVQNITMSKKVIVNTKPNGLFIIATEDNHDHTTLENTNFYHIHEKIIFIILIAISFVPMQQNLRIAFLKVIYATAEIVNFFVLIKDI